MALRFPLGLLGLLLISCSQEFVLSNSTPSFAEGYRAGCKSGSSVASNMTGEIIKEERWHCNNNNKIIYVLTSKYIFIYVAE